MLWIPLALIGALALVGYFIVSHLVADLEELTDEVRLSLLEADEARALQHHQHGKVMREINLLKDRMEKLAKAKGLEWVPQRRVPGQYNAIPSPVEAVFDANARSVVREWEPVGERTLPV